MQRSARDWSRVAGSSEVMSETSMVCFGSVLLSAGGVDEFDEGGHDFVSGVAGEGHAELGSKEAVGFFDVEAEAVDFGSEVVFKACDFG